jgi:hypothetical protein
MKNPILIIVSVILLAGLSFGLWNKNQSANKPPFVSERSDYKGEEIEKAPNFLYKTELADGSTNYYLSSHLPSRPNMYAIKDGQILLQRSITAPNYPVKMSDYTKSYGESPVIEKLNNFYDPTAKLYVYPEEKVAFIANPKTQEVLEQHIFTISVEEYLKIYSETQ